MSKLLKSEYIFVGEPLEIEDGKRPSPEDLPQRKKNPVLDTQKYEQERLRILERAKQEANSIIEKAKEHSREISDKAFKEGYEKGYEEGMQNGRQQGLDTAAEMIEEALQIRQQAIEMKERAIREAEQKIIELVLSIARKVIGEQIRLDREMVLGPVRKALEKCSFSSKVIMRVAPEDYDIVSLSKNKLLLEMEGVSDFEIVMENTLSPGSCILETESGYINSSLEVQLNRIEKYFKELLNYDRC